jgi:hypothetical protein
MVLAMDRLMVTVGKDSDGCVGTRLLQARLHGWAMKRSDTVVRLLLQDSTCAFPAMMAAAALFFRNSSQVCCILLQVMIVNMAFFRPLFGFT